MYTFLKPSNNGGLSTNSYIFSFGLSLNAPYSPDE